MAKRPEGDIRSLTAAHELPDHYDSWCRVEKSLKERIIEYMKSRLSLEEKIFWHVVPLCSAAALLSVFGSLAEHLGVIAAGSVGFSLIIFFLLMRICYKKGNSSRCYLIFCLVLNCFLMPCIFLTNGGLISGMPFYCLGAISLCAFCTGQKNRILSFLLSLSVNIAVIVLSGRFPSLVIGIREDFLRTDMLVSFFLASLFLFMILSETVREIAFHRSTGINSGMVGTLGSLIEFRSVETGDHGKAMREMMEVLLKQANVTLSGVNFSKMDIHMIASAANLHDIGKIAVPERILNKPGKLTEEEFEIIRRHPLDGCQMIEAMRDYQNPTYYGYCYEICRHHHERYDGTGYPDHLKGSEIPLVSQIAALCDTLEALTTRRSYKEAFSPEKSYEIVKKEEGTHFSPQVMACLDACWPQIRALLAEKERAGKK